MLSLTPDLQDGKSFFKDSSRLNVHEAAQAYLNFGWSVIPVHGNGRPSTPKSPALKEWTTYQQRRPTIAELDYWFNQRRYQGLAVVCGSVSHLAVLDIDHPEVGESFLQALPDLADTLTIRSGGRGLPHYYFYVPDGVPLINRRIPGAELRCDGQYIVAPPTAIGDGQYQVVFPAQPRALAESDLSRLLRFFDVTLQQICENRAKPASCAFERVSPSVSPVTARVLLPEAVVSCYRSQVAVLGRNNALFSAAVLARDCGWSQVSVQRILAPIHVAEPASSGHVSETLEQRQREAERTITSAFSRPRRVMAPRPEKRSTGLPNAVREALLQSGVETTAAARLLDALLIQAVWQPGFTFTERQACEVVIPYGIGRRSVRNALKAVIDGRPIFPKGSPPNPLSQNADAARIQNPLIQSNKCFVGTESNRVKSGRRALYYVLPYPLELCKQLGVKPQASDAIQAADLKSPAAYRQAQYRELIRRRPGQYTRDWLSQRLGVSVVTLRRYDRPAGVHAQPVFHESALDWTVASMLPPAMNMTIAHAFLESEGRRFPALQGIALGLLARKKPVTYKLRLPNFYCLAQSRIASAAAAPHLSLRSQERRSQPRQYFPLPPTPAEAASVISPETAAAAAAAPPPTAAAATEGAAAVSRLLSRFGLPDDTLPTGRTLNTGPKDWHPVNQRHLEALFQPAYDDLAAAYEEVEAPAPKRKIPGKPLDDPQAESLALCLYNRLRALNPAKCLTINTARQLVSSYRRQSIQEVLHKLSCRNDLHNPAGFFVKVLKTDHRPIPTAAPDIALTSA